MDYQSIFQHPVHGELRNGTESAKYLGISRRKFRRIAPGPDHIQDQFYPFWATRILDILPVDEVFNHPEDLKRGMACGTYLIGELTDEEVRELRSKVSWVFLTRRGRPNQRDEMSDVLAEYGIPIRFSCWRQSAAFRDGILSVTRKHLEPKHSETR